MPDRAKLEALLAQIENASGPDTPLALEVVATLSGHAGGEWILGTADDGGDEWSLRVDGKLAIYALNERDLPDRSVDAALELAEKVLPGWDYILAKTNDGLTIHAQFGPRPDDIAFGATLPLAICAAIIRAKLAGDAQ